MAKKRSLYKSFQNKIKLSGLSKHIRPAYF
jgi:hypothetical protein